jgi:hypothetical protein
MLVLFGSAKQFGFAVLSSIDLIVSAAGTTYARLFVA